MLAPGSAVFGSPLPFPGPPMLTPMQQVWPTSPQPVFPGVIPASPPSRRRAPSGFVSAGEAVVLQSHQALTAQASEFDHLRQSLQLANGIAHNHGHQVLSIQTALGEALKTNTELVTKVRYRNTCEAQLFIAVGQLSEIEKACAVANTNLASLDAIRKDLEEKLRRIDNEQEELQSRTQRVNEFNARTTGYESRIALLTKRLADSDDAIDNERLKVAQYTNERDTVAAELARTRQQTEHASRDLRHTRADVDTAYCETDQLRKDFSVALARISELTRYLKGASDESRDVAALMQRNTALRDEIERHGAHHAAMTAHGVERSVLAHHVRSRGEIADCMERDLTRARLDASTFALDGAQAQHAAATIDARRAEEVGALRGAIAVERLANEIRGTDAWRAENENFEHRARELAAYETRANVVRYRSYCDPVGTRVSGYPPTLSSPTPRLGIPSLAPAYDERIDYASPTYKSPGTAYARR